MCTYTLSATFSRDVLMNRYRVTSASLDGYRFPEVPTGGHQGVTMGSARPPTTPGERFAERSSSASIIRQCKITVQKVRPRFRL